MALSEWGDAPVQATGVRGLGQRRPDHAQAQGLRRVRPAPQQELIQRVDGTEDDAPLVVGDGPRGVVEAPALIGRLRQQAQHWARELWLEDDELGRARIVGAGAERRRVVDRPQRGHPRKVAAQVDLADLRRRRRVGSAPDEHRVKRHGDRTGSSDDTGALGASVAHQEDAGPGRGQQQPEADAHGERVDARGRVAQGEIGAGRKQGQGDGQSRPEAARRKAAVAVQRIDLHRKTCCPWHRHGTGPP